MQPEGQAGDRRAARHGYPDGASVRGCSGGGDRGRPRAGHLDPHAGRLDARRRQRPDCRGDGRPHPQPHRRSGQGSEIRPCSRWQRTHRRLADVPEIARAAPIADGNAIAGSDCMQQRRLNVGCAIFSSAEHENAFAARHVTAARLRRFSKLARSVGDGHSYKYACFSAIFVTVLSNSRSRPRFLYLVGIRCGSLHYWSANVGPFGKTADFPSRPHCDG